MWAWIVVCLYETCDWKAICQGEPHLQPCNWLELSYWFISVWMSLLSCFYPEPGDVRLVGGPSRCGGMLEIKHRGEWKPVDERDWNLMLAGAVCGQLDCGSVVSARGRSTASYRQIRGIKSDCDASSLMKCFTRLVHSSAILEITCSGNITKDIYE